MRTVIDVKTAKKLKLQFACTNSHIQRCGGNAVLPRNSAASRRNRTRSASVNSDAEHPPRYHPSPSGLLQIMGVFSQLEKNRLVKEAARDRKRANGKVEGRKSHLEARPEVVAEAKRLHRASPKPGEGRRSCRKIAAELAALGHLNVNGRRIAAKSVRNMVEGPARRVRIARKPNRLYP